MAQLGFGGLDALGMYGGYLMAEDAEATARTKKYNIDQAQAADTAWGNALPGIAQSLGGMGGLGQLGPLGQGQQPGMMPPQQGGGIPGGPPQQQMPPGYGPPQQQQGPPPPTMLSPDAQSAAMSPQLATGIAPLSGGLPPGSGPGTPVPTQQFRAAPMPGQQQPGPPPGPPQPPPQQQMPPMQPPGGQQQGGGLDWRMILQKVVQANPGIPPNVLAATVDRAIPLMNSQAQMEWKQQSEQLKFLALQNQRDIADLREHGVERGQDLRSEAAKAADATRRFGIESHTFTAANALTEKAREADQRDTTQRLGITTRADTATQNRLSKEDLVKMGYALREKLAAQKIITDTEKADADRAERAREHDQTADVQIRGQDVRADTAAKAEAAKMERLQVSAATKKEIAGMNADARQRLGEYLEGGRMIRFEQGVTSREKIAENNAELKKILAGMSIKARTELTQYIQDEQDKRAAAGRSSREDTAAKALAEKQAEFARTQEQKKTALQLRTEAINTQRGIYGMPKIGEEEAAQIDADKGIASPAKTGADRIADRIVAGLEPPVPKGLGMHGGFQVTDSLARRYPKFDRTGAELDYEAARRVMMGMTSPNQVRFQQLGKAVVNTFDQVIDDAKKMKLTGITRLNKADIDWLVHFKGNTPEGKLAAKYLQDVSFLKGEVANLESGGYAPTESSWEQARNVINENYGVDEMLTTARNAQRLVQYRLHALAELPGGTRGVGQPNRYLQPGLPSPHGDTPPKDLGNGWSVQQHQ